MSGEIADALPEDISVERTDVSLEEAVPTDPETAKKIVGGAVVLWLVYRSAGGSDDSDPDGEQETDNADDAGGGLLG